MPGYLVNITSQVMCAHGGKATPTVPNPRVLLNGEPTVLVPATYQIIGCTLPPPTAANGPCVSGQFMTGSVRVTSNGLPLLVQTSQAMCVPTGTPLSIVTTPMRVAVL